MEALRGRVQSHPEANVTRQNTKKRKGKEVVVYRRYNPTLKKCFALIYAPAESATLRIACQDTEQLGYHFQIFSLSSSVL